MRKDKSVIIFVLLGLLLMSLSGCMTHIHKVGSGAQGANVVKVRQWYALYGLVPIKDSDTTEFIAASTNYTIKSETDALDGLINILLNIIIPTTVSTRTVTITK